MQAAAACCTACTPGCWLTGGTIFQQALSYDDGLQKSKEKGVMGRTDSGCCAGCCCVPRCLHTWMVADTGDESTPQQGMSYESGLCKAVGDHHVPQASLAGRRLMSGCCCMPHCLHVGSKVKYSQSAGIQPGEPCQPYVLQGDGGAEMARWRVMRRLGLNPILKPQNRAPPHPSWTHLTRSLWHGPQTLNPRTPHHPPGASWGTCVSAPAAGLEASWPLGSLCTCLAKSFGHLPTDMPDMYCV